MCLPRLTLGSVILIVICTFDMLTTLYFVTHGIAIEYNPIMNAFFKISPASFIIAKLFSFVPFVIAIEVYRRHNERFAMIATRFTIVAYLLVYIFATLGVNRGN